MDISEIRAVRRRVLFLADHIPFSDSFLQQCRQQGILPAVKVQQIQNAASQREKADIFIQEVCQTGPSCSMFNRMCFLFDKLELWEVTEELQAEVAFERGLLPVPSINPQELEIWIRNALEPNEQVCDRTIHRISQVLLDRIAVKLEVQRRGFKRTQKAIMGQRKQIQTEIIIINNIMDELLQRLNGHQSEESSNSARNEENFHQPERVDDKQQNHTATYPQRQSEDEANVKEEAKDSTNMHTDRMKQRHDGKLTNENITSMQKIKTADRSQGVGVKEGPSNNIEDTAHQSKNIVDEANANQPTMTVLKAKVTKVVSVIEQNYKNQESFLQQRERCYDMLSMSEEERQAGRLDVVLEKKLESTTGKLEQLQEDAIKRFQMAFTLQRQVDDITEEYEEILEEKEHELDDIKKENQEKETAIKKLQEVVKKHVRELPQEASQGTTLPPLVSSRTNTSSAGPGTSIPGPSKSVLKDPDMPKVLTKRTPRNELPKVSFDGGRKSVIKQVAKVEHPQWNHSTKTKK